MKRSFFYHIFLTMLVSAFFFACNNDSDIGLSLIDENDLVKISSNDTLDIDAYTYKVEALDSFVTSTSNYALIGSYVDPVFGSVQSSFVTQTKIGDPTFFGNLPVVDSVVLYLRYTSAAPVTYGNVNNTNNLLVYEIDTKLDSTHYIDFDPNLITKIEPPIANTTFNYASRDNDTILAIKINNNYGYSIFTNMGTESDQWVDETFNNIFKGIWIKTDDTPEDAAIIRFDITSLDTKLALYYHNQDSVGQRYDFVISNECLRNNITSRDYSSGNILSNLDNTESVQDSVIYLQGLLGLKSKILIPELDDLKVKGNIAINRAELVFTAINDIYSLETDYPTPSYLSLFGINDDQRMVFLQEYITSESYLGAAYIDNKYRFDITNKVKDIISGVDNNNGFYLMYYDINANPSRVVLGGSEHSNRIKLVLTLTEI